MLQTKELKVSDDKTYTLSLSCNAMIDVEKALDMGYPKILADLADVNNIRIASVRVLFWGCFRDHHPDVTVEQAGELMMAQGGIEAVVDTVAGLIGRPEGAAPADQA